MTNDDVYKALHTAETGLNVFAAFLPDPVKEVFQSIAAAAGLAGDIVAMGHNAVVAITEIRSSLPASADAVEAAKARIRERFGKGTAKP